LLRTGNYPLPIVLIDFSQRASLDEFPELMDQPCSYAELRDCLRSIASVNRTTRAYHPTLHWLDYVYRKLPWQSKPLHIVDVGCGYGDVLRRVHDWAEEKRLPVTLTGIDLNQDAVRAAREATTPGTATFWWGNAYDFRPPQRIDIIINSLLMHHLSGDGIVQLLKWMEGTARIGWFINDLHRQPIPYHFMRIASRFTSWHPFVKHDGPVSILRSFRREDWRTLCHEAALAPDEYSIREYRPARLCVARLRAQDKLQ
jgi:SAM-dependent methyltransferase